MPLITPPCATPMASLGHSGNTFFRSDTSHVVLSLGAEVYPFIFSSSPALALALLASVAFILHSNFTSQGTGGFLRLRVRRLSWSILALGLYSVPDDTALGPC